MVSQFKVTNMKCNGCVSSVKSALENLAGVTAVEVSLEQNSATVSGTVDTELAINTLAALGFPASMKENE